MENLTPNTNATNSIIDSNPMHTPSTDSISSLNDVTAIPEFQHNNNKNKYIALGLIALGSVILIVTVAYYLSIDKSNQTEDVATITEMTETVSETSMSENEFIPEEAINPSELDSDPVLTETDRSINNTQNQSIDETSEDLEEYDFENIDLELQQNPGL